MPLVSIGELQLHYQRRGSGPPLLLIMGATGDGDHFAALAELLADDFTVVSYDRRGNSRSPRPVGWSSTSAEEQADDAAALLGALGLAPAAVFGTSIGATIALCLAMRHPDAVRGVALHEPAMLSLARRPQEVQQRLAALVREGMAAGGPTTALERFWLSVSDEANWRALEPGLRARMLENADTFFTVELGPLGSYRPDEAALGALRVPVELLVSDLSAPFRAEIADWLAERIGAPVRRTPGTHTPYHDHPRELVEAIRPFLWRVSAGL
jgi:pimeloyl-ACP methyl ester carboxylesterase